MLSIRVLLVELLAVASEVATLGVPMTRCWARFMSAARIGSPAKTVMVSLPYRPYRAGVAMRNDDPAGNAFGNPSMARSRVMSCLEFWASVRTMSMSSVQS